MSFLWHGLTEQGAQVPVQVDAQGRVIAVDGTPGVSNWDRTNGVLSPAVPGDSVDIGSGNITLNASGSATFAGNISNANITLNASGSATFANDRVKINATGSYALETSTFISVTDGVAVTRAGGAISLGSSNPALGSKPAALRWEDAAATESWIYLDGSAYFSSNVTIGGGESTPNISLNASGTATFVGNITAANVTFRSADPQFYVKKTKNKDALPEYVGPELDLLAEIARLEALVRYLYETLRLAPPAGWPVWDGNDDVLRQLRK